MPLPMTAVCTCSSSWIDALLRSSGPGFGHRSQLAARRVSRPELVGSFDNGRQSSHPDPQRSGRRVRRSSAARNRLGGVLPRGLRADTDISAYPLLDPGSFRCPPVPASTAVSRPRSSAAPTSTDELVIDEEIEEIGEKPVDNFDRTMYLFMGVQYGSTFLLPMLLAVILSILMKRHRIATVRTEDGEASHASLTRRAIAEFIDALVMAARRSSGCGLPQRTSGPPIGTWQRASGRTWARFLRILGGLTAPF